MDRKILGVLALAIGIGASAAWAADTPADVSLPPDHAGLDHACLAILWGELSDVSSGDDPQYTPPQINAALQLWTADAAKLDGVSEEDEGSTPAVMEALQNLTGDVKLYLRQVAFCLANTPKAS